MARKKQTKFDSFLNNYYKESGFNRHKFFFTALFTLLSLIFLFVSITAIQQQKVYKSSAACKTVNCNTLFEGSEAKCNWLMDAGICSSYVEVGIPSKKECGPVGSRSYCGTPNCSALNGDSSGCNFLVSKGFCKSYLGGKCYGLAAINPNFTLTCPKRTGTTDQYLVTAAFDKVLGTIYHVRFESPPGTWKGTTNIGEGLSGRRTAANDANQGTSWEVSITADDLNLTSNVKTITCGSVPQPTQTCTIEVNKLCKDAGVSLGCCKNGLSCVSYQGGFGYCGGKAGTTPPPSEPTLPPGDGAATCGNDGKCKTGCATRDFDCDTCLQAYPNGRCQRDVGVSNTCGGGYISGLCPGDEHFRCCKSNWSGDVGPQTGGGGTGGGGGGGGGETCTAPPTPTELIPKDTVAPGKRLIDWKFSTGADKYHLIVNEKPFTTGEVNCDNPVAPDICTTLVGRFNTKYEYTFVDAVTYRIKVRAEKNCGAKSTYVSNIVKGTAGVPTSTPAPTGGTQPTSTPGPQEPTPTPGGPTPTPGGPTPTPGAPTVTPGGPTATPGGPTPTGQPAPNLIDVALNLNLLFQGIVSQPSAGDTMEVKISLAGGGLSDKKEATADFTVDEDGIWSGSATFAQIPEADDYYILVKGEKHVQKKVCDSDPSEDQPGYYYCSTTPSISLADGDNDFDFSQIKLLVGDLPQQDGIVDSYDLSFIRQNLGSKDEDVLSTGDLNLDGVIDTQDFSLMIESLEVKYDDE